MSYPAEYRWICHWQQGRVFRNVLLWRFYLKALLWSKKSLLFSSQILKVYLFDTSLAKSRASKFIQRLFFEWMFRISQSAIIIPANFFWDISVRFLSWECQNFRRWHNHFRRFPKKSEVFQRRPKSSEVLGRVEMQASSQCFSLQKSEIARKVLSFIHFSHGFCSLHGSDLTYFWKLCQARWQQLTFFNQAWEIGPQAWAGVRSRFSTRRRETHA